MAKWAFWFCLFYHWLCRQTRLILLIVSGAGSVLGNPQRQTPAREAVGGLYDAYELAALLDISASLLDKWRPLGEGPPFVRIGAKPYYRLRDVREWIESLPTFRPARSARVTR